MWSVSVLSAKSRVAFWPHRDQRAVPVFSGHDIPCEGYMSLWYYVLGAVGDGKRRAETSVFRADVPQKCWV